MHDTGAVARGDALKHLQHPPLELRGGDASRSLAPARAPPRVTHNGGEVEREPLEDEDIVVAVAAGEVVDECDDVGGRGNGEESLGLAASADGVVDLLERDSGTVGSAAPAVDISVGAGARGAEDLVAGCDISAAVDTPAPAAADRHRCGIWEKDLQVGVVRLMRFRPMFSLGSHQRKATVTNLLSFAFTYMHVYLKVLYIYN